MGRRRLPIAFLVATVGLCALPVQADPAKREKDDWTRIAPADVALFVEIRDLASIQTQFRHLGIWDVVRELSRPKRSPETVEPWPQRAERSLGLHPDEAIRLVLGRRAALLATDPAAWQHGVLVAEAPRPAGIRGLLRKWHARSLPPMGPVQRYKLEGGTVLAIRDATLVFGPAEKADDLWVRTVHLLATGEGPSLASQSEFAGLRWRVSESASGFAYVKWHNAANGPSGREYDQLMIGFTVDSVGMTCDVHGRRAASTNPVTSQPAREQPCLEMGSLPASTIAFWTTSFDFAGPARRARLEISPSDLSVVELFLSFFLALPGTANNQEILGPRFAVVVDSDRGQTEDRFEWPWIGIVLETPDPSGFARQLETIVQLFVGLMIGPNERHFGAVPVESATCCGLEVRFVNLQSLAEGTPFAWMPGGAELCWVELDDRVVLSTSRRHLESIVKAYRGEGSRLGANSGYSIPEAEQDGSRICESCFVKGDELSRVLFRILAFARREHPEALHGDWWQSWAAERLEQRSRLGVGLKDDPDDPRRAVVVEIGPVSPARGRVMVGDLIVEAGGAALTTGGPAKEVARRYRDRGEAGVFSLKLLRGERIHEVTIRVKPRRSIDLSGFDPPEAVRNLALLLRRVEGLNIYRFATPGETLHATAKMIWSKGKPPKS